MLRSLIHSLCTKRTQNATSQTNQTNQQASKTLKEKKSCKQIILNCIQFKLLLSKTQCKKFYRTILNTKIEVFATSKSRPSLNMLSSYFPSLSLVGFLFFCLISLLVNRKLIYLVCQLSESFCFDFNSNVALIIELC